MFSSIDEIEQRKAHRVNIAWVRNMPDEMLERWYKLITREYRRRKNLTTGNNDLGCT